MIYLNVYTFAAFPPTLDSHFQLAYIHDEFGLHNTCYDILMPSIMLTMLGLFRFSSHYEFVLLVWFVWNGWAGWAGWAG